MNFPEVELFPRKYRRYFTDQAVIEDACPINRLTIQWPYTKEGQHPPNENFLRYVEDFRKTFSDLEKSAYDAALKFVWLEHRFGRGTIRMPNPDKQLRANFRAFLSKVCMVSKGFLFSKQAGLVGIVGKFAEDFHPGFYNLLDPFKSRLEFPFKHVTLMHVGTVASMDEALGLLAKAEKEKMTYNEFLDFIANWVACYNEKYGEKYQLMTDQRMLPAAVVNLLEGGKKSRIQILPDSKRDEPLATYGSEEGEEFTDTSDIHE